MNGVFITLLRSIMALMDKLDDNEKVELCKFLLQRLPKSVEEQENERIVADFKKQTQRVNEILDSMKEKAQKDADEMLTNVPADADREAQQDQEDQENDHHYEDDSGNVVNSSSVSGSSVEHEDEERLTRKYMRSRMSRCIFLAVLAALVVKFSQDAHHTAFVGGIAPRMAQKMAQRWAPLSRATPQGGDNYGDRVFEDLFGDEEDSPVEDSQSFKQSDAPRRMEQDVQMGDLENLDLEWDDLEEDNEEEEEGEEELPETEAELMESVKVSDDEVDEFLAEFNAKPILQKEPGTVPLDPFEKDATTELDTFKELQQKNRMQIYGRGMADNGMFLTLRDRLKMLSDHAPFQNGMG
eukprot:symbB.v1.2.033196.t1/scaffold4092.1/size44886/2